MDAADREMYEYRTLLLKPTTWKWPGSSRFPEEHVVMYPSDSHKCRSSKRFGISLVEILISIGIVGMLAALLMPAVQAIRLRASKMQCSSNMRQIGVAAHNYHSTFGMFPGGTFPMIQMLPSLGQGSLADQIMADIFNSSAPFDNGARVAVYMCPDDTVAFKRSGSIPSYLFNGGAGVQKYGWNGAISHSFQPGVGTFLAAADFSDGLSQTAMMSELLVSENGTNVVAFANSIEKQRRFSAFTVTALWQPTELEAFTVECEDNAQWPSPNTFFPRGDSIIGAPLGYNHILTPNKNSCLNGSPVLLDARTYQSVTANSNHAYGVNVLLGDGSIRFIPNSVDCRVWRSMGSRNGSDSTSE